MRKYTISLLSALLFASCSRENANHCRYSGNDCADPTMICIYETGYCGAVEPLAITKIDPSVPDPANPTTVTVTGTGFVSIDKLIIDGTEIADFRVVNNNTIEFDSRKIPASTKCGPYALTINRHATAPVTAEEKIGRKFVNWKYTAPFSDADLKGVSFSSVAIETVPDQDKKPYPGLFYIRMDKKYGYKIMSDPGTGRNSSATMQSAISLVPGIYTDLSIGYFDNSSERKRRQIKSTSPYAISEPISLMVNADPPALLKDLGSDVPVLSMLPLFFKLSRYANIDSVFVFAKLTAQGAQAKAGYFDKDLKFQQFFSDGSGWQRFSVPSIQPATSQAGVGLMFDGMVGEARLQGQPNLSTVIVASPKIALSISSYNHNEKIRHYALIGDYQTNSISVYYYNSVATSADTFDSALATQKVAEYSLTDPVFTSMNLAITDFKEAIIDLRDINCDGTEDVIIKIKTKIVAYLSIGENTWEAKPRMLYEAAPGFLPNRHTFWQSSMGEPYQLLGVIDSSGILQMFKQQ